MVGMAKDSPGWAKAVIAAVTIVVVVSVLILAVMGKVPSWEYSFVGNYRDRQFLSFTDYEFKKNTVTSNYELTKKDSDSFRLVVKKIDAKDLDKGKAVRGNLYLSSSPVALTATVSYYRSDKTVEVSYKLLGMSYVLELRKKGYW